MTCDAWQASNADAYFAATGHWVEEVAPGQWEIHCALIGFTRMNTSHSGRRLARVLYELSKRMGIVPKVRRSRHMIKLFANDILLGLVGHLRQCLEQYHNAQAL